MRGLGSQGVRSVAPLVAVMVTAALATTGLDRPSQALPGPARTCSTASVLSHWTLRRLVEQTIVVPVDENNVGSISREVADGAGGARRAPVGRRPARRGSPNLSRIYLSSERRHCVRERSDSNARH